MNKIILFFTLTLLQLQADDFQQFLQSALQNNASLQNAKLRIEQTKLEAKKLYRYENPNLEGSFAKYDDENGFSVGLSQKIPLPGSRSDLKELSTLLIQKAQARYRLEKARLTKKLSLQYLDYIRKRELAKLAKEELALAQKIYTISKSRYTAGTISKSRLLQAKLSYHQSVQNEKKLFLKSQQSYYDLLLKSGIAQTIPLTKRIHFLLIENPREDPLLTLFTLQKKIALAKTRTETKTVETYELLAEYEKEPDQDIMRLGISLPVALFHQKNEEKKIASLSIQQEVYSLEKYRQTLSLKREKLQKEYHILQEIQLENHRLLKEQKNLLTMFEEGYKIANINLLELQNIKNALIQTKKEQITLQIELEQNIIYQNYLNGAYND